MRASSVRSPAMAPGEMAEAARKYMARQNDAVVRCGGRWANALTRAMLGVRLDVDQSGDWSMVRTEPRRCGSASAFPTWVLHGPAGRCDASDLTDDNFVALYFTDVRRRPVIPADRSPAMKHYVVSRWDAPIDSGLRERSLFDLGGGLFKRVGCPERHAHPGAARRSYRRDRADQGRRCGGVLPARRRRTAALSTTLKGSSRPSGRRPRAPGPRNPGVGIVSDRVQRKISRTGLLGSRLSLRSAGMTTKVSSNRHSPSVTSAQRITVLLLRNSIASGSIASGRSCAEHDCRDDGVAAVVEGDRNRGLLPRGLRPRARRRGCAPSSRPR